MKPLLTSILLLTLSPLYALDLPPMPEAVTSFGAVISDGWLYVYGGHKAEAHSWSLPTTSGAFHRLNLNRPEQWEALPGGLPAQSPGLAAHDGKIYLIGGMQPQNATGEKPLLKSLSTALVYEPKTAKWEKLPELPQPRSSHDIAVLDGKLYALGGWPLDTSKDTGKADDRSKSRPLHDTALVLDLSKSDAQWQSIPQPFQRRAVAVVAAGDKLYALGGMDAQNKVSAAADVFTPATSQWSQLPELPTTDKMKAFAVAACALRGEVIASPHGGSVYVLRKDAWQEITHLQRSRFFHQLEAWEAGQIIALGGTDDESSLNTLEVLTVPAQPAVSTR